MLPETDLETTQTQTSFKEQVAGARERVRGEAANFAASAREKAFGAVEQRQTQAVGAIGDFADAIRVAGDRLSERNQGMVAQVVRQAADGLEGWTRSLESKRPQDMIEAVRDFGRRNPAAFIGGSLLVGLAIGRFIRSSMPEGEYGETQSFAAPEWEAETAGASMGGANLDANSEAFDADAADLTMSPEGASVTVTNLDDEVDTSIGTDGLSASDDEFGQSGSTTRGV